MKKIIAMILCVVLCLGLLAACGDKAADKGDTGATKSEGAGTMIAEGDKEAAANVATPAPEAEYYDEISIYLPDGVPVLSLINKGFSGLCVTHVCLMIWDSLIEITPEPAWNPAIATEWKMSDDGMSCYLKLRDDVYFHNGEHMTADDVLFTIELSQSDEAKGTHLNRAFTDVASCKVLSDYEVEFTLKEANQDFANKALAGTTAAILSRKAFEEDPETAPMIGTGPWKVKEFVPNVSLTLERNDQYWGEMPKAKTCVMRTVPEQTAKDIMLKNGELTFGEISGMYVQEYLDLGFTVWEMTANNCEYLSFNQNKPLMQDKNFRLAVAYALNKQAILNVAYDGYGKLPNTIFWGYNTAYRNPDIAPIDQDIEKAKEYLAQSSYNGETVKLSACVDRDIKAAQMIQEQLMAIGIDINLVTYDQGGLNELVTWDNTTEDLVCHGGIMSAVGTAMDGYTKSGQKNNVAHYSNPELDEIMTEAKATVDGPEREALYYKAQEILAEDIPYITLFHVTQYYAAAPGAGGAVPYPTTYVDWSQCYRVKE